jgi:hypothetical protein
LTHEFAHAIALTETNIETPLASMFTSGFVWDSFGVAGPVIQLAAPCAFWLGCIASHRTQLIDSGLNNSWYPAAAIRS